MTSSIDLPTTYVEQESFDRIANMNAGPEQDAFARASVNYAIALGLYKKAMEFQRLITAPQQKILALQTIAVWLSRF